MKHYVIEYIDRSPLRAFILDYDPTVSNENLLRPFITHANNRMNTGNALLASRQVNYYCQPNWIWADKEIPDNLMVHAMASSVGTIRADLFDPETSTVPIEKFTEVLDFLKYIGFDTNQHVFRARSRAGRIDRTIRP